MNEAKFRAGKRTGVDAAAKRLKGRVMPLKIVAIGLFLLPLLGACAQHHSPEKSTRERLADQYEFENRYLDVDDPD